MLAQLVFMRYGAGKGRVGRTAESAMAFLKGLPVETMREIVAEALDSAFLPHVYRDALDLVARHRERGERSFIVSAALQEIVDALVARARARRGHRLDRRGRGWRLHGSSRSSARRQREGGSGRRARQRGGHRPRGVDGLLRLGERRSVPRSGRSRGRGESRPQAARDRGRARLARPPVQRQGVPRRDDRGRGAAASDRARAWNRRDADALVAHFADAERRGKARARLRAGRVARDHRRRSVRPSRARRVRGGLRALGRARGARLSRARGDRACDARRSAGARARRGRAALLPERRPRVLGPSPGRGRARSRAHGDVAPSPSASERRRAADRARIRSRSRSRRATVRRSSRTSRWARSRTATFCPDVPQPEELVPFGGEQAHKAFALAVGLELLVSALAGPEHGIVLVVARPDHDPVPAFRQLAAGRRLPGDSGG